MDVLVVGCGAMGRNHVRAYGELQRVERVLACDPSPESLKGVSGMPKVEAFASLDKALAEKPDCAVVAAPTKLHHDVAGRLLEKGLPLLVEKPITETVADGLALVDKAARKKVPLLVGHIERFNPAVQVLKSNLRLMGDIIYASAHRFGVPTERDVGSSFIDQAVHDIDVISFLTGKEPSSVFAIERRIADRKNNDLCSALFDFGPFTATVEANRVTPIKTRELILLGTKGTAKLNYITQDLALFISEKADVQYRTFDEIVMRVGRGTEIRPYFSKAEPLKLEAEHFLDCVEGKAKPLISGREAVVAVAAAQAGQKSALSGKKEIVAA